MAENVRKNDAALIAALAAGASVASAARSAGLSERTARRRLEGQQFRDQVEAARVALIKQTIGRLSAAGVLAADTLHKLLSAESETVRLGASRATLEYLFKGNDSLLLLERVEALEARLAEDGQQ